MPVDVPPPHTHGPEDVSPRTSDEEPSPSMLSHNIKQLGFQLHEFLYAHSLRRLGGMDTGM